MRSIVIILLYILLFTGCATYYQEPTESSDHALLTFQESKGGAGVFGNQDVIPLKINGFSPSYYKWDYKSFRIKPGETNLQLRILGEGQMGGSLSLSFNAKSGEVYHATRVNKADHFEVTIINSGGEISASGNVNKKYLVR